MAEILTERNAWVTTTLAEGRLVFEGMTGNEDLGELFGYELALRSDRRLRRVDLRVHLSSYRRVSP
jgi:hypothetical protein